METFALTHTGYKRKHNEDRYFLKQFSEDTCLIAVADGMGGQVGGALASQVAIKILTSYDPQQSCGIGTFTVENMDMEKLHQILFDKHKVYTTTIQIPDEIQGIRVTPSIYTTLRELNIFIESVSYYIKHGLPS